MIKQTVNFQTLANKVGEETPSGKQNQNQTEVAQMKT